MHRQCLNRDLGTGDLCDNIGVVGVSAKWSYVTASPNHHDKAIPILTPLLFMHVGHPYIRTILGSLHTNCKSVEAQIMRKFVNSQHLHSEVSFC